MTKKLVSMILAVLMSFSLVACGGAQETGSPADETTGNEVTDNAGGYSVDEIKIARKYQLNNCEIALINGNNIIFFN